MPNCKNCSQEFKITQEDLKFYEKVSPIFDGKKLLIPPPTNCPACRQQRRLAWQNMMKLYSRKCDFTDESILSNFSPDKKIKVYKSDIWWSDKWDTLSFGRDFDFNRPFFEQFKELMLEVPLINLSQRPSADENSDYTNYALYNKNCYLIFHANDNEDSYYGLGVKHSKNVVDVLNTFSSELLYECVDCENCYNLKFSQDCENCADSFFLHDCTGCKNCIACKNLRNKEYYVLNKKVTKEEFEKISKELNEGSYKEIKKWWDKYDELKRKLPHRAVLIKQSENCSGDHIFRCKNVQNSFDMRDTEDAKYCNRVFNGPNSDLYDINQFGEKLENAYECSVAGINATNLRFCMICRDQVDELTYCLYCQSSSYLFGCISCNSKKYCILNKQYTKDEYEKLVPQIIEHMKRTGEWGEFFPIELSPFDYNESVAHEYYPLTKEESIKKGLGWKEIEDQIKDVNKKITVDELPDSINDVPDDILNWAIECKVTKRPFKIQKAELQFYKRMNLPIPRLHPDERHLQRFKLRNPNVLRPTKCTKCSNDIQTSYNKNRPEKIYCEECYLKEVY